MSSTSGIQRRDAARRAVVRADRPLALRRQPLAVEPQPRSQGSASAWSWLPGTSTTVRPASAPPELLEHRARHLERLRERALAQLDHVAEQHEAVGVRRPPRRAPRARLALARDVGAGQAAEVEVGDDGRPHRRAWCQAGADARFGGACRSSAATTASSPSARSARRARCSTRTASAERRPRPSAGPAPLGRKGRTSRRRAPRACRAGRSPPRAPTRTAARCGSRRCRAACGSPPGTAGSS